MWTSTPGDEGVDENRYIVGLSENYEYAVVGHPSRDYLWILSRTQAMEDTIYRGILERLENKGYDLDRLQLTRQPAATTTSVQAGP